MIYPIIRLKFIMQTEKTCKNTCVLESLSWFGSALWIFWQVATGIWFLSFHNLFLMSSYRKVQDIKTDNASISYVHLTDDLILILIWPLKYKQISNHSKRLIATKLLEHDIRFFAF